MGDVISISPETRIRAVEIHVSFIKRGFLVHTGRDNSNQYVGQTHERRIGN